MQQRVSYEFIWIRRTCDDIELNVHYSELFSSEVRVRIRFSIWLVSCYAHVFVLLSVVIVTLRPDVDVHWGICVSSCAGRQQRRLRRGRLFRLEKRPLSRLVLLRLTHCRLTSYVHTTDPGSISIIAIHEVMCPGTDWLFKPALAKSVDRSHQQWRN